MDHHQNPSQEQHNQNQNRRRPAEAAGGQGQNQLPHPPPQACPRCNSNNTKFCYYNNYSLAQPRYFCKGCRRYWTQGGTLRSVPVGGGSRKRKRPNSNNNNNNKMSSASTSATAANTATTIQGGRCSPMEQQPPFNFELSAGHQLNSSSSNMSQNPHPPTSLFGTPISTNANTLIYGGGGGGFFSSLAGFPPVNFGPNLGLLHGLGLPNLDHHHNGLPQQHQQQQHQQQQQEEPISFQQLLHQHHHQNLHPGSISAPSFSGDWILNGNKSNNLDNNNNNDNNNNDDDPNHWPDFQVGNTDGLEDP